MNLVDYEAALIDANCRLAETIFGAAPDTPIPTCPGWSLLQLMRHVGRGDRWAAHIITSGSSGDLDPRTVPDGRPPDGLHAARTWLEASPRVLLDAVATVGSDACVGTFLGPRPARWWIRRRLHEATVHRADAALATEQPYELSPEIAADGIEEWLERLTDELPSRNETALAEGAILALTATDFDLTWTIHGVTPGINWTHGTAPDSPTMRLSGPTTDLFLALTRRRTAEQAHLDLAGDSRAWTTWLTNTPL